MKITNKNLRAAKRRYNNYVPRYIADFVWPDGFLQNRTHQKSENAAYQRKSDPTAPKP